MAWTSSNAFGEYFRCGKLNVLLSATVVFVFQNSNDASFAVITTDAPDWFNVIHSRMPVSRLCCILQLFKAVLDNHDDIVKWLNPTIDSVDALQLIAPESTVEFMSHMVDAKYVNNVRCRDNDCVCPILSSTDEHQLNIEENKLVVA